MLSASKSWSKHFAARRICKLLVSMFCLMICASVSLQGQTIFGRISGTVTDRSGAVIPNAMVTVKNTATNLVRSTTTDQSGFYTVTNLPVGTYTVVVEEKGFKKAIQADYALTADARLTVDIILDAGELSETVLVSATTGG